MNFAKFTKTKFSCSKKLFHQFASFLSQNASKLVFLQKKIVFTAKNFEKKNREKKLIIGWASKQFSNNFLTLLRWIYNSSQHSFPNLEGGKCSGSSRVSYSLKKIQVQEGVDAVRASENYAFLLESTMNEYHNQQLPCNTHRIGNTLNSKNYGIATPSGSYLLNQLTVAILVLMERGYISGRESFWWYEKGECQQKAKSASVSTKNN